MESIAFNNALAENCLLANVVLMLQIVKIYHLAKLLFFFFLDFSERISKRYTEEATKINTDY